MLSRWIATIVATAALVPGVAYAQVGAQVAGKWVAELTSPTLRRAYAGTRVVLPLRERAMQ